MIKNTSLVCPHCGEEINTEVYDIEFDGEWVRRKMQCNACDAEWTEYFEARYDGYAYDNKEFSVDGECISEWKF